ncbi:MFS transporter [Acrocarpospora corrugata]|uniref:MFS transporter n=1 Tax=Acrocarpospora corrugata TaxID=35763 RepID=A0A5M3WAI6_9ACTN|nr:MFS transporter [Acrocarpospora corrugata]GES05924.1 MFS transporter [Acrocarpospora corrugata]
MIPRAVPDAAGDGVVPEPDGKAVVTAGMFRSLRNYNYRLFALGGVVSNVGTWMQRTAQDWLVLSLTGGSGTALGITVALQFLPMMLFGLWGGMLADRYPKRKLLLVAESLMGLLALAMGVLIVSGAVQVWHVFVMAFLLGLLACVEVPTRQAFVVEMVGHDDLSNAIALNSSTFNLARVVGPALAGVLIYLMGTGPIFMVNAVSFGAVIAGLLLMRKSELRTPDRVPRAKGQLREGLRYVWGRPDLLLPMLIVAFVAVFAQSFSTAIALMATNVYGAGSSAFGIASSALAIGALGGALLAARRIKPSRRFLLLGAAFFGIFQMMAALAPGYVTFLILLIPAGMAMITVNTTANATVQMGASHAMRGRVMGIYILVFTGGAPIGAPLVGWLAELAGPRVAVMVTGALSLMGVGLALLVTRLVAKRQGLAEPLNPARAARRAFRRVLPSAAD